MTDFVIRGTIRGDQATLEQINDKINACIDWVQMRREGVSLEDAVYPTANTGEPMRSWQVRVEAGQTEARFAGVNSTMSFVEEYDAISGQRITPGGMSKTMTNVGDLVLTLDPADTPRLVRVVAP